jgi:predicted metal-dependent hydrolase
MNKQHKGIDYSKLKHGEKEFYAGVRSLHPEYEHPKKRLKEYQRKIFYED